MTKLSGKSVTGTTCPDMQTITSSIGLRLKTLREKKGLTMAGLSELAGLSQAQICRLEAGKQGFRSATLRKLADVLHVKVSYLFCGDGIGTKSIVLGAIGRYGPRIPDELKRALQQDEFKSFMQKCARLFMTDEALFSRLCSIARKTKLRKKA